MDFRDLIGPVWVKDRTLEEYCKILLQKHALTYRNQTYNIIPPYILQKPTENKIAINLKWKICEGVLTCGQTDVSKDVLFVIAANGSHYVLFEINGTGLIAYDPYLPKENYRADFMAAANLLAASLRRVLRRTIDIIEYRPCQINQTDGYNCGPGTILQLQLLITGRIPNGIATIDGFRSLMYKLLTEKVHTMSHLKEPVSVPDSTNQSEDKVQSPEKVDTEHQPAQEDNDWSQQLQHVLQSPTKFRRSKTMGALAEFKFLNVNLSTNTVTCNLCQQAEFKFSTTGKKIKQCSVFYKMKMKILKHVIDESQGPVTKCKTLDEVLKRFPFSKTEGGVKCDLCKRSTKMFKCNTAVNVFPKTKRVSIFLNNLKRHLISKTHANNDKNSTTGKKFIEKNYTAGMAIAHNAYKLLKTLQPFGRVEEENAMDSLKKVIIGDIGHSNAHMPKIRSATAEILRERLQMVLDTPLKSTGMLRPFSVVADKVTVYGVSYQLIGIIVYHRGKLQYFMLDCVVIKSHTGSALADDIVTCLKFYVGDNLLHRFAGASFDGQYFLLGVDNHLREKINNIKGTKADYYSFTWDVAHLIELADSDAKSTHEWSNATCRICQDVASAFRTGKGLLDLHATYKNRTQAEVVVQDDGMIDVIVRNDPIKLKSFCATRFAAHAREFFKAFLENFIYFTLVGPQYSSLVSQISSAEVAIKASFLYDYYNLLGKFSTQVQSPNIFPWHVVSLVEDLLKNLNDMSAALKSGPKALTACKNLTNLFNCILEISGTGTFRGEQIDADATKFRNWMTEEEMFKEEEYVNDFMESFAAFVETCCASLQERFEENLPPSIHLFSTMFAITEVSKGNLSTALSSLREMMTKFGGVLFPKKPSLECLEKEYAKFANYVRSHYKGGSNWTEERLFYGKILGSQNEFPLISHLLASSVVRTFCESVVEGTASILKRSVKYREKLSTDSIRDIMYIKCNGPNAGLEADKILKRAMKRAFGNPENWHFFRRSKSSNLKNFQASKVIDKINRKKSDKVDSQELGS